jgi:hypothetical protein
MELQHEFLFKRGVVVVLGLARPVAVLAVVLVVGITIVGCLLLV